MSAANTHRFTLVLKDRGPVKGGGRFDRKYAFSFQADVDTAKQLKTYFEMAFPDFENPPHTRVKDSEAHR